MFKLLRRDKGFYRSLCSLAVPIMVQNLITSSLGMVDTVMVGTLGQNELAGLSLANTPFMVAMLFVFGLQSGGAVLISQYWGKRDMKTINRVMGLSWAFAVGISFLFATIIFIFPRQVMGLTTNNAELIDVAVRYGRIVAYSYAINAFVSVYIGAMRCCEAPKVGAYITTIGMVSNVIFNYIFIFGKLGFSKMGVEGAALGTLMARILELVAALVHMFFFKKKRIITFMPKYLLRPGKIICRDFIKYAAPVMINETLWGLGTSVYTVIYGHMEASADVVAAVSVAGNVERIVNVAIFAIGNAAAVMVGKSIGTGASKEEVYDLSKLLLVLSCLVGLVNGAVLLIALFAVVDPWVFELFSLTEGARRASRIMMIIMSGILFARAFNMTLVVGVLRGGGDVRFGLLLDVGSMYFWVIPLAAIVALVLKADILWVYLAVMSEEPIKFLVGMLRFRSKKWISNVTRELA